MSTVRDCKYKGQYDLQILLITFQCMIIMMLFMTAAFFLLFPLQYYQLRANCKEHMSQLSLSTTKYILTCLFILLIRAETINISFPPTFNPSITTTPSITSAQSQDAKSKQTPTSTVNQTNNNTNIAEGEPVNGTTNSGEVYEHYGNITLLQLTSNNEANSTNTDTKNYSLLQNQPNNQISNTQFVSVTLGEGNNSMMDNQQLSYLVNQLTKLQEQSTNQGIDSLPFQYVYSLNQEPSNQTAIRTPYKPQQPTPTPQSFGNTSSTPSDFILDAMKIKVDSRFIDLFRD